MLLSLFFLHGKISKVSYLLFFNEEIFSLGLIDQTTLKKIIILEAHETDKIHSILPKNQLEAKFGGNLPDLTKWW